MEKMKEDRLAKQIDILYSREEEKLKKEICDQEMEGLKRSALQSLRLAKQGRTGRPNKVIYMTLKWAAVIILVVGIPAAIYLVYQDETPDYSSMVEELSDQQKADETSLILSDGSSIAIESDESVITYDESGEKVEIDAKQTVTLDKQEDKSEKDIQYNRLVVPYGRKSTVTLADGSVVWLNSGSYLIYPQEFSKKKREVYLAGEAYFQVNEDQDRPFIVLTDDIEIEVLGTTFNVNSYPENKNVETVLVEGSVKVSKSDSRKSVQNSEVLNPGQLATYSRESEKFSTNEVDVEFYISWKDGYFLCNKITLEQLAQKLSRHYNVQIMIEGELLKLNTFSGKLDNKETIYEVLEVIDASKSIDYTESDGRIIIRPVD